MRAKLPAVVAALLALPALAACSEGGPTENTPQVEVSEAEPLPASPTPDVEPSPVAEPVQTATELVASCSKGESDTEDVFVTLPADGDPVRFDDVWGEKYDYCEIWDEVAASTAVEKKALQVSKYEDDDVSTLYSICLQADPSDYYAADDTVLSAQQVPEVKAALKLCPEHPLAKSWKATLKRDEATVPKEATLTIEKMQPVAVENCIDVMLDLETYTLEESAREACELTLDPSKDYTHALIDQYYTMDPDALS